VNGLMHFFLLVCWGFFGTMAHAEVFKCVLDDKTVYQPDPCPDTAKRQEAIVLEKTDPAKAAEAQARLQAWQDNYAKREAAERQAQKERQAELDRQAHIEAINRAARAQEELAEAARHPNIINRPYIIDPYFTPYGHRHPPRHSQPDYPQYRTDQQRREDRQRQLFKP
jgi:hypothetical protein